MEKLRLRVQETLFSLRGISAEGIARLYRLGEVSIPGSGVNAMIARGFSEADAALLVEHWGDSRVRISDFHPKKMTILRAIEQGKFPSEIAEEFEVSKTYVLRLMRG